MATGLALGETKCFHASEKVRVELIVAALQVYNNSKCDNLQIRRQENNRISEVANLLCFIIVDNAGMKNCPVL